MYKINRKSFLIFLSSLLIFPKTIFANKSSVEIECPEKAPSGNELEIKIKVFHHGNNIFHYTNWVYVKVNGEEIKRWEYSITNIPENENFTKSVKVKILKPIEIEAMANCNLHGSMGKKIKKISILS